MSAVLKSDTGFSALLLGATLLVPFAGYAQALDPLAAEDEPAVTVEALYIGDVWHNSRGGLRTGDAYLGNGGIAVGIDGERTFGLDGTAFYLNVQSIHGRGVSSSLVGDAQGISNIEAHSHLRLYEVWLERTFGHRSSSSLRFGLYDINSEFDFLQSGMLFLNGSSGLGPQLGLSGHNGPSTWPATSLGMRLQWSFAPAWFGRVALLDGVPGDPDGTSSHRIQFGSEEGALAITEVGRSGARLRKVAVGAWAYTARFEEIAAASTDEAPARHRGNRGYYAIAEGQVYAEQEDASQGLNAFVRIGTAEERINRFDDFWGAGLVYTGALPGRDEDQVGLAVVSAGNGSLYRHAQLTDGAAADERETSIELTYRAAVTEWLTLQASLQHVSNPDTNPDLSDAMAFGLRFELSRGWSWPPSSRHRLLR